MPKRVLAALMLFATVAAHAASFEDYARVIDVQEKYASSNQHRAVVCDNDGGGSSGPGLGTAVGAVAGGLLGAQVGKGNGKVAAAAAGAAAGALTGNHLENANKGRNCVADGQNMRVTGYNVTYEYAGRTFTEFSSYPPNGETIKVRVNLTRSGR